MITKVWIIVDAHREYNGSSILEVNNFYLSPMAAELAICDANMEGIWVAQELTLGERT